MSNAANMPIFRQGDVLVMTDALTPMPGIPEGAELLPPDANRVILAYGEVTGHAHALPAELVTMYRWQGNTLISVKADTALRHEEHDAIPLAPGTYRVLRQMQYSPEAPEYVAD